MQAVHLFGTLGWGEKYNWVMRNKYWRLAREASQGFFAASVVGWLQNQPVLINRIKRWWQTNKWGRGARFHLR